MTCNTNAPNRGNGTKNSSGYVCYLKTLYDIL
ncbi:hypothetical protein SAMN05421689_110103 [Leptospira interrogans]|nr:hypothetical protein SAMN05421689_110103 [Leptospira interrogans]